jgi:hypothetical protein
MRYTQGTDRKFQAMEDDAGGPAARPLPSANRKSQSDAPLVRGLRRPGFFARDPHPLRYVLGVVRKRVIVFHDDIEAAAFAGFYGLA